MDSLKQPLAARLIGRRTQQDAFYEHSCSFTPNTANELQIYAFTVPISCPIFCDLAYRLISSAASHGFPAKARLSFLYNLTQTQRTLGVVGVVRVLVEGCFRMVQRCQISTTSPLFVCFRTKSDVHPVSTKSSSEKPLHSLVIFGKTYMNLFAQ